MSFPTSAHRLGRLSVLLVPLALAAGAARAQQGTGTLPSPEARLLILEGHDRPTLRQPQEPLPRSLQDEYDVLHYRLRLLMDPVSGLLRGTCTITLRSLVPALERVELDLHAPEFAVGAVRRIDGPGQLVPTRRDVDKLLLDFPVAPPRQGEEVVIEVPFAGRPRAVPGRSPAVTFERAPSDGSPRIHSFSEPGLARGWWPCKDRPDDKATIDLELEAPQEVQVAANGRLREVRRDRDGYLTWVWAHDYPIATYLVGFSAARFARWSEPWSWRDEAGAERRMNVAYWSWPELGEWAYQDFATTPRMLDAFSERFGTYPFTAEQYGLVMFGEDGGMEHQTASGIGGSVVALSRGTGAVDNLLAHELAHQWWGNDVGIDDWDSIWLKEGLATWSEALWWEEEAGLAAYLDYMADVARPLGGGEFEGTVDDPTELFGQAVYYKGAWVVHMLRWVLSGPSLDGHAEPLLELLRAWRSQRSGGTASTEDFVEFFSREASLEGNEPAAALRDWFFPQWLEREGRPVYAVGAASHPADGGFGWSTDLRIEQRQEGEPYAMPLHLRLHLEGGGEVDLIRFVAAELEDFTEWTRERVVAVELDPEGWVLKAAVQDAEIDRDGDGWADWRDGCPDVPDPAQRDDNENGLPDACEPGLDFDEDGRPNEADCAPADPEAWSLPEEDTVIRVSALEDGGVVLFLDHPDPAGQRPYRADVASGTLVSLRRDGSMVNSFCIADDHEEEVFEPPLTFGRLGTYWVVRPVNGCPPPPPPEGRRAPCP